MDDAGGEVRRACGVEWDGDDSAEEAAEEGGDPLGGVFAPEDDAVAGGDGAAVEFGGEAAGELGEFAIGGAVAAIAAMGDDRRLGRRAGGSPQRGWRDEGARDDDSRRGED